MDFFGNYPFSVCLIMGTTISTVNGALMPIIAYNLNLDPAKIAGPLEMAFQDIVGQSFLLGLAMLVLIPLFHVDPTSAPEISTTANLTALFAN
jgi:Mg/Co/Ni transporter MgtE